jgi:hypothetical protein
MESLALTKCPACDSSNVESSGVQETYFLRNLDERVTIRFGACLDCDFVFQLNPLTPEQFERYYQDNSQLRTNQLNLVEEHVHHEQANFVSQAIDLRNKAILEIGSSTGKFLNFLKTIYACETFFDEKNEEAIRYLTQSGHRPIADSGKEKGVSVLVLRHIVEHVPLPVAWLKGLQRYLATDGLLFIEVPDWSFLDDKTNTFAFEHVNHFSQFSLSTVLKRAGYIVIRQEMAMTAGYATSGGDRVLRVIASITPKHLDNGVIHAVDEHHYRRVGRILALTEKLIQDRVRDGKRVAFYGASWGAERIFLNTPIGAKEVCCIFDQDAKKQKGTFYDVPVNAPHQILKIAPDTVFIFTSHEREVKRNLIELGYKGELISRSDLERL